MVPGQPDGSNALGSHPLDFSVTARDMLGGGDMRRSE
jgi:hypothetical protein